MNFKAAILQSAVNIRIVQRIVLLDPDIVFEGGGSECLTFCSQHHKSSLKKGITVEFYQKRKRKKSPTINIKGMK